MLHSFSELSAKQQKEITELQTDKVGPQRSGGPWDPVRGGLCLTLGPPRIYLLALIFLSPCRR